MHNLRKRRLRNKRTKVNGLLTFRLLPDEALLVLGFACFGDGNLGWQTLARTFGQTQSGWPTLA